MSESLTIPESQNCERVDRALAAVTGLTRSAIVSAIKNGRVQQVTPLKKQVTKNADRVVAGETYLIEPAKEPTLRGDSRPINWQTQLIYEDNAIIVLNKQAGQVVHPSAGQMINTIAQCIVERDPNIITARYDDSELSRQRPGIVHRLDKETSGVMVIAKTKEALLQLQKQFKKRTITKEYQAICYGHITGTAIVDKPIGRHPTKRQKQSISETGKPATTCFEPIRCGTVGKIPLTLVLAKPVTGRTHQIRVHLKHLHHPIIGDQVYQTNSSKNATAELNIHNLLLHAAQLNFTHPVTGADLSYEAPLPSYFLGLLDRF